MRQLVISAEGRSEKKDAELTQQLGSLGYAFQADWGQERNSGIDRFYSITSSARARRLCGTSMPSVLAVLRLMTSSYLVDTCTGKSAGFSPLRMRST